MKRKIMVGVGLVLIAGMILTVPFAQAEDAEPTAASQSEDGGQQLSPELAKIMGEQAAMNKIIVDIMFEADGSTPRVGFGYAEKTDDQRGVNIYWKGEVPAVVYPYVAEAERAGYTVTFLPVEFTQRDLEESAAALSQPEPVAILRSLGLTATTGNVTDDGSYELGVRDLAGNAVSAERLSEARVAVQDFVRVPLIVVYREPQAIAATGPRQANESPFLAGAAIDGALPPLFVRLVGQQRQRLIRSTAST